MTEILLNAIVSIATLAFGGGLLFYRQTKISKRIDNESRQSEEWRKLYDNEKEVIKECEDEIKELNDKVASLSEKLQDALSRVSKLENTTDRNERYYCSDITCNKRVPKETK